LPIIKIYIFLQNNYFIKYFFNPILKKERAIATKTSSNGDAFGTPKFQTTTPISQIIYIVINFKLYSK